MATGVAEMAGGVRWFGMVHVRSSP
jgi:hypothetical protein